MIAYKLELVIKRDSSQFCSHPRSLLQWFELSSWQAPVQKSKFTETPSKLHKITATMQYIAVAITKRVASY